MNCFSVSRCTIKIFNEYSFPADELLNCNQYSYNVNHIPGTVSSSPHQPSEIWHHQSREIKYVSLCEKNTQNGPQTSCKIAFNRYLNLVGKAWISIIRWSIIPYDAVNVWQLVSDSVSHCPIRDTSVYHLYHYSINIDCITICDNNKIKF